MCPDPHDPHRDPKHDPARDPGRDPGHTPEGDPASGTRPGGGAQPQPGGQPDHNVNTDTHPPTPPGDPGSGGDGGSGFDPRTRPDHVDPVDGSTDSSVEDPADTQWIDDLIALVAAPPATPTPDPATTATNTATTTTPTTTTPAPPVQPALPNHHPLVDHILNGIKDNLLTVAALPPGVGLNDPLVREIGQTIANLMNTWMKISGTRPEIYVPSGLDDIGLIIGGYSLRTDFEKKIPGSNNLLYGIDAKIYRTLKEWREQREKSLTNEPMFIVDICQKAIYVFLDSAESLRALGSAAAMDVTYLVGKVVGLAARMFGDVRLFRSNPEIARCS